MTGKETHLPNTVQVFLGYSVAHHFIKKQFYWNFSTKHVIPNITNNNEY